MIDATEHVLDPKSRVLTVRYCMRIFTIRRRHTPEGHVVECVRAATAQVAARFVVRGDACDAAAHEPHVRHERDAARVWTFADRHHPASDPLLEIVFAEHCIIEEKSSGT